MAKLPLVIYPDDILKTRCADITEVNQDLVDFLNNMVETMYVSQGIGLAAPQVARNIRMVTVDVDQEEGGKSLLHLINPVIVEGHGRTTYEEGCLSFPGLSAEIRRKKQIHVKAYDIHGGLIDLEADGLLSICIQHELDHLNGVTFVDRLSPVQRKLVVRGYLRERAYDKEDETADAIRAIHGKGASASSADQ